MIGVNAPKRYPNKPFLAEKNTATEMTDYQMIEFAKSFTKKLGGTVK